MICPICHERIPADKSPGAHMLGHSKSPARAEASRRNGMKTARQVDWSRVDWSKRNAEIARELGVSTMTVGRHRP